MLQPSLDDVVLSLDLDSNHVEFLCWRMPLLVHTVEAGEAQPDHSAMLVQGHVAPVLDDGAAGHHLCSLARLVEDDGVFTLEEDQKLCDLVHTPPRLWREYLFYWCVILSLTLLWIDVCHEKSECCEKICL